MSSVLLPKLNALRNAVRKKLEATTPREVAHPRNLFDPTNVAELFTRYEPLRDELKKEFPSLFNDLPIRTVKPSGTTEFGGRGYINRLQIKQLLDDIENCLDLLSGVSKVEIPSMKVTREGVYFAGQYFDALKNVKDILSNANRKIDIVDGYIDEQVLDVLTSKKPAVEVNILTKKVSPSLKIMAQGFNQQYGKLSMRSSQAFHDRFIIIDDLEYYHFGASLKDAGRRGFMFSRIEEQTVIDSFSKKFAEEWKKATIEV